MLCPLCRSSPTSSPFPSAFPGKLGLANAWLWILALAKTWPSHTSESEDVQVGVGYPKIITTNFARHFRYENPGMTVVKQYSRRFAATLKNMPCLLPLIIEPVANLHFVYSLKMNSVFKVAKDHGLLILIVTQHNLSSFTTLTLNPSLVNQNHEISTIGHWP